MPGQPASDCETAPLTGGQFIIWHTYQEPKELASEELAKQLGFRDIWPIPEGVSHADVTRAFEALVSRHEILRTYYSAGASLDEVRQIIRANVEYEIDLHYANDDDWEAQAKKTLRGYDAIRVDLTEELSWKAALILTRETPRCLVFAGHHIAVDPFALTLLKDEFTRLINGQAPVELGNPLQPRELAEMEHSASWQRRIRQAADHRTKFLERIIREAQTRTRSHEPVAQTTSSSGMTEQGVLLSNITPRQLEAIASQYSVTPASLILSLLAISASKLANVPLVPIGLILSNRVTPKMRTLVCNMPGISFVTAETSPDVQFNEFVRTIHGSSLNAQRYALNDPASSIFEETIKLVDQLKEESLIIPVFGSFQHQPRAPEIDLQNSRPRKDDKYIELEPLTARQVAVDKSFGIMSRIRNGYLELRASSQPGNCRNLACSIRKNIDFIGKHPDTPLGDLY